jgi:hypothetical protein
LDCGEFKNPASQYETNPNSFFTISDHIENLTPQFSEKDGEDENQEADRLNWDCIRDKSRASLSMSGTRVLCFVVLIDSLLSALFA